jgi:hypothetical protein
MDKSAQRGGVAESISGIEFSGLAESEALPSTREMRFFISEERSSFCPPRIGIRDAPDVCPANFEQLIG